jgi:hypothetical protein
MPRNWRGERWSKAWNRRRPSTSGIEARIETLPLFAAAGAKGEFLKLPKTRRLFRSEQYLPSEVIDRNPTGPEEQGPSRDTFCRARQQVTQLLASYQRSEAAVERESRLRTGVCSPGAQGGNHAPAGNRELAGGGRGIRTPGALSGSVVFKTTRFDRSRIPPLLFLTVYQRCSSQGCCDQLSAR